MPEAQYNLGSIYLDGLGVVQNFSKAFSNFLLSAENGFEMSQYKLSLMFLNGWGTDTDKIKALILSVSVPQPFRNINESLY